MAFDLDGLSVLASMAAKPEIFVGIEIEATKIARALLIKTLKNKATTLPNAKAMASALPDGTLAHIIDGMTDAEVATLATRFDRLNSALKAADRYAKAALIGGLISGAAEPAAKAAGSKKAVVPKSPAANKRPSSGVEAATKVLKSKAMGARKAAGSSGS